MGFNSGFKGLSVINILFDNFLDIDKETLVQKVAATQRESLKQL